MKAKTAPPAGNRLLSKKEAAEVLGVCTRTLDKLIGEKRLQTRLIGRRVLIAQSTLDAFMLGKL